MPSSVQVMAVAGAGQIRALLAITAALSHTKKSVRVFHLPSTAVDELSPEVLNCRGISPRTMPGRLFLVALRATAIALDIALPCWQTNGNIARHARRRRVFPAGVHLACD
jgi:hypothetical protein